MKPATVNRRAKELMDDGKIAARLDDLRIPAVEASRLTLEKHLAALEELRDEARNIGQLSAAINAEVSRGKAAGLYVARQEITGKDGEALAVKDESPSYDLGLLSEAELTVFAWLSMKAQGFDGNDPKTSNLRGEAQALVKFDT
jgi:hypothetical protein